MPPFQYLTIQDVLWINLQATLKVEKFDFARLEEAVFYQYALGDNSGLVPQATRFLTGFLRMKPFDVGNEATAFIACATYLRLNGRALTLPPAEANAWLEAAKTRKLDLAAVVADAETELLDVKGAAERILETFGDTFLFVAAA